MCSRIKDAKEANVKRLRNEVTRNAVAVTVILIHIDNYFNRLDKIVAVNFKVFDNIFRNFTLHHTKRNYDYKNYAIQCMQRLFHGYHYRSWKLEKCIVLYDIPNAMRNITRH